MSLLRLAYVVAVRRTISNWRLEMVLLLSIVLAVALMSSGVIFSDLVAEAALHHTLGRATPDEANIEVRTFIGRESFSTVEGRLSAYQQRSSFVDQRVGAAFAPYVRDRSRLLEGPTFFFQGHPQLELDERDRPRGNIQYLRGLWPERSELVQGRWPYTGGTRETDSTDGTLEVAVDVRGAELLQLGVGEQMEIFPPAAFVNPPPMTARIVGVFRRADPTDEFWYSMEKDFSYQGERWNTVPLFTTEDAIFHQVVTQYPSLFMEVAWYFYLDREAIRAKEVNEIQQAARGVTRAVYAQLTNGSINMKLTGVLDEFEDQLLPTRIPLFLILFLVTGILIYYLALVAGLIVKSRSTELALLKSRGATIPQLGVLALVEGLLLAVPAVVAGPFLAQGVVRLLGKIFFDLGGSGELAGVPVALSSQAFLIGLAGGLLAVAALTGFTLLASKQSIVEFRHEGARPARTPFIHRYYLDILFLVLIGALWWQTQSRDTFLVRSLGSGELEIDYSLLLGPVLLLLAVGLLVLRFFPLAVALLSRLAEPVGPSWLVHGLRHISRAPILPGVLVVMLMLATALGVIGSTFSSTLERSQRDQALYAAGADLHIQHSGSSTTAPLEGLADLAMEVASVDAAAEARRMFGSLLTKGFSERISILAVDTSRFGQVAWYRPDFADGKSLNEIIAALKPDGGSHLGARDGILLPLGSRSLGLWVQSSRPDPQLNIRARLKDANDRYFDVQLGHLGFRGWRKITADLAPLPPTHRLRWQRALAPDLRQPYSLQSLYLFSNFGPPGPGTLFLGHLSAQTPDGEVPISDFQDLDRWHILEDYSQPGVSSYALEHSELVTPEEGGQSSVFSWTAGGIGLKGVGAGGSEEPVPAMVSKELLEAADARVGDTLNVRIGPYALALKVVGVVGYFPSIDPADRGYAVVDLEVINHAANLHSPRLVGGSTELWVNLGDGTAGAEAVTSVLADNGIRLSSSRLASELVSANVDQPLVNAGWGGLLVLVFLVLALASASGVMLFSYIDTRERRTEFALLRTLGSSAKQLNSVVWFSIFLIVVCGIGLGSWVGFQTGASLLPLMWVAEEGTRVVPPLVLKTNWTTLLVSYLVLAGVTAATVVWLAWLSARMEIHRSLRIGEG